MYNQIIQLLNVKPGEISLVKKLFLVQFFLGLATAFLFTSSLTLFLAEFQIKVLPRVYMLAALLLLGVNYGYARLEARLTPENLLKVIITLSAGSLLFYWCCLSFFASPWLSLLLAVWNMVIYMVVGYAFWGMAAVLFNVRESKRLFSIVGAGDIPAKMLGYFSVSVLVPIMGVKNLVWISIGAFAVTYYLLRKYAQADQLQSQHPSGQEHGVAPHHAGKHPKTLVERFFYNRLIFFISLWSLLAYVIFSIIDFTFLAEIKNNYQTEHELAAFLGIFFALGRFVAIFIKMIFSSRVIARLGLANALLVTPLLLLGITGYLFIANTALNTYLYVFGCMVLVAEILKSTLQEPVFFILFQPLNPHTRLKGHLIAKGYTLPFALLGVGIFLTVYLQTETHISIPYVVQLLVVLLVLWAASVPLIRQEYRDTLVTALKKGYFSETDMFLNDNKVINTLLKKLKMAKPMEVIHALNLLERANYLKINKLLLAQLHHPAPEVQEYVLNQITEKNLAEALPQIKNQLRATTDSQVQVYFIKAIFYLDPSPPETLLANLALLSTAEKKAALVGLLQRKNITLFRLVQQELEKLVASYRPEDRLLVCQVITEVRAGDFSRLLEVLLHDTNPQVFNHALEAAGRVQDLGLLPQVIDLGLSHKAYSALTIALLEYGDVVFTPANLGLRPLNRPFSELLVKVAGKVKGDNSTWFLLDLLTNHQAPTDNALMEALWAKKTKIPETGSQQIKQWVESKLAKSQLKAWYYRQLSLLPAAHLLQSALGSEIKQDLMALLKALALIFDRPQTDRIIQLYGLENQARLANAIEMLDLMLPKKYFVVLNSLIELLQDIKLDLPVYSPVKPVLAVEAIVQEILTQNKAQCNAWTRSVALYIVPKLPTRPIPAAVLHQEAKPDDILFRETQAYVLSVLN